MATLYNAVSRNGDSKTEKLLLTFSDLVYIHDAGGYDLANDCIEADATTVQNVSIYKYLTFTALENTTFTFTTNALQYSLDDGATWTTLAADTASPTVTAGNKIMWKQTGLTPTTDIGIGTFSATGNYEASGNIMSLYYGDDFVGQIDLTGKNYAFCNLFYKSGTNNTKLINVENLILPATTLADYCYYQMFRRCTKLTATPKLPATTLVDSCYRQMFRQCTSLTTAPELPATTLINYCYYGMFWDCTSLTTAPELPATTLASGCYRTMFDGCTSLSTAPELPATTLASHCYESMFQDCTSLATAPELPATTLKNYCYQEMFKGCTSLNYIKCLATNISATCCTTSWTDGVAATGTFVKNVSTISWIDGVDGVPTGWTMKDDLKYLAFTALENTTFRFSQNALQYSLDDGATWTTLAANTNTPTVTAGNKIMWKQTGLTPTTDNGIGTFFATGNFEASGNIMSLYYGDNFASQTNLTGKNYAFFRLFNGNTKLTNAENLILPATTLADSCYRNMFNSCTSLTTAPDLPATKLVTWCYFSMFKGCTSLTAAPKLPATTLKNQCYYRMFYGCTSLITAPELPATTLAENCYREMFYGCTSLTTAPELPATTLAGSNCYNSMFYGCTSLATAPELPATTLSYICYRQMFYGCTSLTTAPELPATTLTKECYYQMFYGCTSLNYINCLATNISATDCTTSWTDGVAATGTFVKNVSMIFWIAGVDGVPTGWTTQNDLKSEYLTFTALQNTTFTFTTNALQYSLDNGNTWTILAANTASPIVTTGNKILWKQTGLTPDSTNGIGTFSATGNFEASGNIMSLYYGDNFVGQTDLTGKNYAFCELFRNCYKLINAENLILPATTLATWCYADMFPGCRSLTTAPELPATTLASNCYYYMFSGCASLTTSPKLPATTLAHQCYGYMFNSCTKLTTAPELPATTLVTNCYQGMFNACTSLTTATELPATTLATNCYRAMFYYCTSLTTAPELPATTLVANCYMYMFYNCTSLNYIKCLATNISATDCTKDWVTGVAATGIFVKEDSMTSWTFGVNGIPSGWIVPNDLKTEYLTFTALENTTFTFSNTLQYSLDNGATWTTLAANTNTPTVTAGNKILWKQTGLTPTSSNGIGTFSASGNFKVSGNIMSLYYEDDFAGKTDLTGKSWAFLNLFNGNTKLINAENLILPATTLADRCYIYMFKNCTSLTTAPELPATTLTSGCYAGMFYGCTSLTTAPELPATRLVNRCYGRMFYGCTSLNYIKCLATNILYGINCTESWVYRVASTGTFIKNGTMASWTTGANSIPTGWTVQSFSYYNKYSYIYTGNHNYLSTTTNITSSMGPINIENSILEKKITRLRRTLPYVKNLDTYDSGTDQMFYFKDKYYTPYVIHIGLEPYGGCITSQYQDYYPNNRSTHTYSYNVGNYTYTGIVYTYLPNISLYSDMYCGVFPNDSDATTPINDLTQYSPSAHIIGNTKSVSPFLYAHYLGSYFYRYVWRGREEDDDSINTHYNDPVQNCVRPGWNVFSRNPAVIRLYEGLANGINIASAISYIDLVVEFDQGYVNDILGTNLIKYVNHYTNTDNYSYSYNTSGEPNKLYFRFSRYDNGGKYWGQSNNMDWGIYNVQTHRVENAIHNTNVLDFGKDDSNVSILTRFVDLLKHNCTDYFNNIGDDFIDANQYNNNKLVIKSDYNSHFNATIKALHINVVNNTSYINSYNSCSIIENQYQYWYARIGNAFKTNMINIYVNSSLINQGTSWGWGSSLTAKNACTPIHIYNGLISENGGNKPIYGEDPEPSRKWIYENGKTIFEDCIPLDYLESYGEQYIDTGIFPNKNTRIYIEFTPTIIPMQDPTSSNSYNVYFCGVATTDTVRWNIGFNKVNNTSKIIVQYNGANVANVAKSITLAHDVKYFVELYNENNYIIFNCGKVGETSTGVQITAANALDSSLTHTIRLFGSRGNTTDLASNWSGKIHCCKIWNGYKTDANLLIDLIPVRYNTTNTYCMYDRISKKLFYNIGTGSFNNAIMMLWIDDFPNRTDIAVDHGYEEWTDYISDVTSNIVNRENTYGANPYIFMEETFEWNDVNYYLWQYDSDLGVPDGYSSVEYLLTDTIDYTELYERSLANDPDNYGGIVCFLDNDLEEYRIVNNNSSILPDEASDSIILVEKLANPLP